MPLHSQQGYSDKRHSRLNAGPLRATAGPAKHYRRALSPPPFCMSWDRGRKCGERCPLTIRRGVWGSVVSSPSVVRGSPAENGFYAYFRSERSHLEHNFQYFWSTAGPPNVAGPGKTFPPFPPSRRAWYMLKEKWLTHYPVSFSARLPYNTCNLTDQTTSFPSGAW